MVDIVPVCTSYWPQHGLLVTGGFSGNGRLSSTEYLSTSGHWTPGPGLPTPRYEHCQVTIGQDVLVLGKYYQYYYYYSVSSCYYQEGMMVMIEVPKCTSYWPMVPGRHCPAWQMVGCTTPVW